MSIALGDVFGTPAMSACENVGAKPLHDTQDIPAHVIHPVGREAVLDYLADVEIIPLGAEPQEGRFLRRHILAVRAAQRFDLPPQTAVQLESDEDRGAVRKLHKLPLARHR